MGTAKVRTEKVRGGSGGEGGGNPAEEAEPPPRPPTHPKTGSVALWGACQCRDQLEGHRVGAAGAPGGWYSVGGGGGVCPASAGRSGR